MAVQLLFCGMLLQGFAKYNSYQSCAIAVKLFLYTFSQHPYSSMDTTAAWKKLHFILSDKSDFHVTDNLSIAVHTFASHILMSFSVDETLLPRYVKLSTSFRELLFSLEMSPLGLKHIYSILFALTWN